MESITINKAIIKRGMITMQSYHLWKTFLEKGKINVATMAWRTTYPNAYSALETIVDDPQNITSQLKELTLMEDPYRGSTDEQDRAYRDLDRITCEETKNLCVIVQDAPFEEASFMLEDEINEDNVKGKKPYKAEEEKDFTSNEVRLLKELLKEKTEQVQQIIKDQAIEYYKGKISMQKKEELWQSKRSSLVRDLTDALKIIDQLKAEQIRLEEQKDKEIRKLKPQFQKKKEEDTVVQFFKEEFPPLGNTQTARPFIETEAYHFGNTVVVPKVRKITNQHQATHRLKQCSFLIEGNKFKIPLIYAFDMHDSNGIGANFLMSMKGGIRMEGDEITIFKRLKHQGYIRKEPLKFWKKNGELCKLDIINPDITIEDRPLKHVTSAMEDSFRKHVDCLLRIGDIRPSKSRHQTMAMIVNSGTTIDPVTGKEIKGKERIVFNYKSLNDNTYKDQYSLPGINTIIKRVGGVKIFSKFDLKSGFHQVAMDEESIPWTAFLNEKKHARHLERMLKICEENGLVLSLTKMKIAVPTIDFLGAVIGEGAVKLQPHIIKKIDTPKTVVRKTNACGDKRLKPSDYELVRKSKHQVQNLPDLEIPPEDAYIILETDGCMEGWGGIVKWKNSKEDCIGEMRQLTKAALYLVEEVLQSLYASQKNMKNTYEEVMKIFNHFQESSQGLSLHMKNQEYGYITKRTKTKQNGQNQARD
ncbi:hypothetical protein Tco_0745838 [Tanacetum coccineum]